MLLWHGDLTAVRVSRQQKDRARLAAASAAHPDDERLGCKLGPGSGAGASMGGGTAGNSGDLGSSSWIRVR